MAERVRSIFCSVCIHLQKEDPIISGQMALYRCTSQKRGGRVVGWCPVGKFPKNMGCSCCNRLYPGDQIEIKSYFNDSGTRYLYCGKVGDKYLLYRINNRGCIEVDRDYLRGQTGNISNRIRIVMQDKTQLEASKRMVRKRKARWMERNEDK